MLSLSLNRLRFANFALRAFELDGTVVELLALITLISFGLIILAAGAGSSHKPIGQEQITLLTVALLQLIFANPAIFLNLQENLLSDGGVPGGAGPPKVVKVNIKPLIDSIMNGEEIVANLLGRLSFLQSLNFCSRAILVRSADIQYVISVEPLIPSIHISR